MTIELTYRYNELDEQKEFGLEISDTGCWAQWVWYAVGTVLKKRKVVLLPYSLKRFNGKILKTYTPCQKEPATWYGKRIGEIILKKGYR